MPCILGNLVLRIESVNEFVDTSDAAASSASNAAAAKVRSSPISVSRSEREAEDLRRQALLRSAEAFERELSAMLTDHSGEWVAFVGSTRFGFAETRAALIRACTSQGLRPGEFLVRRVEFQSEDVQELPRL